jgi:SAM-dependent methyltransferase
MSFAKTPSFLAKIHPELNIGGYLAHDGTVEFYGRVRSLVQRDSLVVDFGAGRGAWFEDDDCEYRKRLRLLRGDVARVVGCDVDPSVFDNRSIDEACVFENGKPLPFKTGSIDLILSDYVLEHIADPTWLAEEVTRCLKPGGWVCARTPTKWNYVSLVARLVPNAKHTQVLRLVQPNRKEADVFPTAYLLNTRSAVIKAFGRSRYEDFTYTYTGEPQYHCNSAFVYRSLQMAHRCMPARLHGNLFIFLRKRSFNRTAQP